MMHVENHTPHRARWNRFAAVAALAVGLVLATAGCTNADPTAGPSIATSDAGATPGASASSSASAAPAGVDQSILAQLPSQFVFASGAGGWATTLTMKPDGSFTGAYLDANMGDTGADYPNGTTDESNFTGTFVVTAQVSKDEYTLRLASLTVQSPTGTSTIQNGTLYVYQEPYGFENAQDFSLYLPGSATSALPQAFIGWAQGSQGWDSVPATLPCWGLYNIGGQEGFTSQDTPADA